MNNWFKCSLSTFSLICLSIYLSLPVYAADYRAINKKIRLLESEFKSLSSEFYQESSSYSDETLKRITDIEQLLSSVEKLINASNSIAAIQLIYFNIETLNDNLDTKAIFKFINLLLDKNEWHLANTLFNSIKNEGDKSLLATVQFIFAKYHAQRNEWPEVNKLLEGNFTELSEENAAYAYLLNGSALQHRKKHRLAIKNYNKIKKSSQYYGYAQLNTAIANIRQGWWTDAQTKIQNLLKLSKKTNQDELTNRLYLVLGYALLQREFYRDARDAFRHIGLKSRYTNRALLGIGLTATSQGDYVGGLNALTILKNKKTFDLSVDESYLLVPYVYEKLQQEKSVTTTYTEGINYYQRRIKKLEEISTQHADFKNLNYNQTTSSLIIQNNSFNFGNQYPEAFIRNFQRLNEFNHATNNSKIKNKISRLIIKFDSVYQNIIIGLAKQRKSFLKSYLNQSRYGLARLYDKTNELSN